MATRPPVPDPSPSRPGPVPGLPDTAALPPGTRLGEFEILSVLGVGGFGIVYRALDHALGREVAIKEYMPSALADRTETLHVSLRSQASADTFALGLRSFVNEARLLARFDHPALVKVYRFWEQNNTAYMVMPLYRGRTLKQLREAGEAALDEAALRRLLSSLLGALERLHDEGVFHRDISPDNIVIEPDGRPVLLDFGAARHVIADRSQNLTAILKPSYAPIEQYAEADGLRQGAWTDLYALGATLHFLLRGVAPPPSTVRTLADPMKPLAGQAMPEVSVEFLAAIDWMLEPRPDLRPGSVASLRQVLSGKAPLPPRPAGAAPTSSVAPSPAPDPASSLRPAGPSGIARPAAKEVEPATVPVARTTDAEAHTVVVPRGEAAKAPAPATEPVTGTSTPPPVPAPSSATPPSPSPRPASAAMSPSAVKGHSPVSRRPLGMALAGLGALGVAAAAWVALSGSPARAPAVAAPTPAEALGAPPGSVPTVAAGTPAPASPPPVATAANERADPPTAATAAPGTAAPGTAATVTPAAAAARPPTSAGPSSREAGAPPARLAAPPSSVNAPSPPPASTVPPSGRATAAAPPATMPSPAPAAPAVAPGPAAATAAAPSEADELAAAARPNAGPREICGRRVLVALWNCMSRQCSRPALASHPECKAWKESTEWHRGTQNP
jgi:serine/threonine protein kinase